MRIFVLAAIVTAQCLVCPEAQSAAPLAQNYSKVFHNPDRERYVEGCGLVRLDSGNLVAVVPVVPRMEWSESRRATQSRTHLLLSKDGGATWNQVSELPYYSAVPWTYEGKLYLFANKGGTKFRNDDLLLLQSSDEGRTWSSPVTLFKGHYWNCQTGIVIKDHTIYAATDDLSLGNKRGPLVVAGDLRGDIMSPQSWRRSEPVAFKGIPNELLNAKFEGLPSQYLEPNVIVVGDRIRVLATVKPRRQTTANICAVFDVADEAGKLDMSFTQFSAMPGGQLKFCVIQDPKTKLYWATTNQVVDSQGSQNWWKQGMSKGNYWGFADTGGNDRRLLMLMYSLDGLSWFQAGCIAQASQISQSFMYATPVIDGNDLVVISRTSIDAPNQHDADYATFHRVKNFRDLALNLSPSDG